MVGHEHLAAQLRIEGPSVVKRYTERAKTAYEHAWEIRDAYGYHPFEDAEWGRPFRAFLHGRAWTGAEGPVALFNQAVGRLRRHRVLLPGVSMLAKQVASVRQVAEKRLYATAPRGGRTRRCRRTWWRCFRCRKGGGSRSWSGFAGRRRGPRARAWRRPWSGWTRSPRSGWAG